MMCIRANVVLALAVLFWQVGLVIASEPAAASHAAEAEASGAAAAHGQAGAHEAVNTDPLEFRKDLAIWTGVVFLILLVVLRKFAWGPIADGLDKREMRIAADIAAAEKSNADARRLLEEYQQKLAASEDHVRQMIDAAKRDAEKVGQGIVDRARAEAKAEQKRALDEIDQATAGALKELAQRSATLAVDLAGKIVAARLDPAAHSRLIEQAVAGFTQGNPGRN